MPPEFIKYFTKIRFFDIWYAFLTNLMLSMEGSQYQNKK